MKKYRVRYDAVKAFGFAYETIEARGLMHAFKLADSHLKEIKKSVNAKDLHIAQITEKEQTTDE